MPAERLLIVGLSGRALAQSARAAGLEPIVLDAFGDLDMRAAAGAWRRIPLRADWSFRRHPLLRAAVELAPPPIPLLVGSGFERRPELLAALAAGRELLGATPAAIATIKDPFGFAAACAIAGVPHPAIRADLPKDRCGWLVKRRGGAGGGHVRSARGWRRLGPGRYLQCEVPGRAVSILLLGDGRSALPLLATDQGHGRAPSGRRRFETVLAPSTLPERLLTRLSEAAIAVARTLGEKQGAVIRGLTSADFLVAEDGSFHLLEINARPGASLEVAEAVLGTSLIGLHVEACRGRLPVLGESRGHAATTILYAPSDLRMPLLDDWPVWAGDRTQPGEPVRAGAPLATVLATAADAEAVRALAARRKAELLERLGAAARPIGRTRVKVPPHAVLRERMDDHALD